MTELKPCPFCVGEARLWHPKEYGITLGSVKCNSCGASTELFTDDDSAIEAWNNRPSPWHTGTPTEKGWYLIKYKHNGGVRYIAMEDPSSWVFTADNTIAWQKIEPYKEKKK